MSRRRSGVGAWIALGLVLAAAAQGQAQEPSASPAPAAPAGSDAWMALDAPALRGLDAIEQATTTESEIIVVGSRCATSGVCRRPVLSSVDGMEWEARGLLPADLNLIADVTADEVGLLVVGNSGAGDGHIWRSSDGGATWEPVGDPSAFAPGADGRAPRSRAGNPYELSVLAVARGPGGLVAGGWLNSEDTDRSALWRSVDGETWERVRLPSAMDRGGGIFDVAAGEGGYVAVTGDGLWRSRLGQRWERASTRAMTDDPVTDVEAMDDGFIGLAVGAESPSLWSAGSDGGGWRREPRDPALEGLWEAELRAFGSRVFAAGRSVDEVLTPIVWSSEAGSSWRKAELPAPTGALVADIGMIGDVPLVFGTVPLGERGSAGAIWRGPGPGS